MTHHGTPLGKVANEAGSQSELLLLPPTRAAVAARVETAQHPGRWSAETAHYAVWVEAYEQWLAAPTASNRAIAYGRQLTCEAYR